VHRNVVSLIALDFILGVGDARVVRISLVINVFRVHPYDLATDVPGLRVPGYLIADSEFCRHDGSPKKAARRLGTRAAREIHLILLGGRICV